MNTANKRNPKFYNNSSIPDTDSRGIELFSKTGLIEPNLMFDHTRMQCTVPTGFGGTITFGNFINGEERSLHLLVLNNGSNNQAITFKFSQYYNFLDDNVQTNIKDIGAGETGVYYGFIQGGKLYLREGLESTT